MSENEWELRQSRALLTLQCAAHTAALAALLANSLPGALNAALALAVAVSLWRTRHVLANQPVLRLRESQWQWQDGDGRWSAAVPMGAAAGHWWLALRLRKSGGRQTRLCVAPPDGMAKGSRCKLRAALRRECGQTRRVSRAFLKLRRH